MEPEEFDTFDAREADDAHRNDYLPVPMNKSMMGVHPEHEIKPWPTMFQTKVFEISLGEPETVSTSMLGMASRRVYPIWVKWNDMQDANKVTEVKRRFNHFKNLHEILLTRFPNNAVPILPDDSTIGLFKGDDSEFIQARWRKLKHFITYVSSHYRFGDCSDVIDFISLNDNSF